MSEVEDLQHTRDRAGTGVLMAVSNAMVALHKEQFGRGPARARTNFAGDDTLVCTLEDALLPAERTLVELHEEHRVQESRLCLQRATRHKFISAVEDIVGREVVAFSSATDPQAGIVWEVFKLSPSHAT